MGTTYCQRRETFLQYPGRSRRCRRRSAAEQEQLETVLGGTLCQTPDEVRAADPFRQGVPQETARPDKRHPVGNHEIGSGNKPGKFCIMLALPSYVGVCRDNPDSLSGVRCRGDMLHTGWLVHYVKR